MLASEMHDADAHDYQHADEHTASNVYSDRRSDWMPVLPVGWLGDTRCRRRIRPGTPR